MNIELASLNNLIDIKELYELLFSDMAKLQPKYFQTAIQEDDFIKSIIESERDDILIAKEKNQILGFALVQEQTTPAYHCFVFHRYAYLMDIVVAPDQRGKGVAKALLNEVINWAKIKKLEYVELSVLTQNKNAIEMYEKMDFVECSKVMRMNL